MSAARVLKAELHVHIEGTMPPALARRIAARNGISLDPKLFADEARYAWTDFSDFLSAYDAVSACVRRSADLSDIVHAYLGAASDEGAIYVEFFASPDHAAACGLSYVDMLAGLADGIARAERERGIVGRIVVVAIRHLGPERAEAVAGAMARHPHPHVVGFGLAGDETCHRPRDFRAAFHRASDLGLGCTAHAGEVAGAESVRAALDDLPLSRVGHGVRAIEDPKLVERIARDGIALEICPGSNLALGLYPDVASHPLRHLIDVGCRVTLGSDDPPYFGTSIGREYARAEIGFGLDRDALLRVTRTAIQSSFADAATKSRLLAKVAQDASLSL